MSTMTAIKKVTLTDRHLPTGRTKHTLITAAGSRSFDHFTNLTITCYPERLADGFWLMYGTAKGLGTDTWHLTLEDALHQAEWEFNVNPNEWVDANEPF